MNVKDTSHGPRRGTDDRARHQRPLLRRHPDPAPLPGRRQSRPDLPRPRVQLEPRLQRHLQRRVQQPDRCPAPRHRGHLAPCAYPAGRSRSELNDRLVARLPSQLKARNRAGGRVSRRRPSPDKGFWIDVEVTSPDDRSPPDPNRPEPIVVAAKRLKHRSPQSVSQTSLDLLPVAQPQPDPIVVEWCHGLDGQHGPMLAERRNLVRWQLSAREFPVRLQLGLVHHRPLDDQSKYSAGQLSTQDG